MAKSINEIIVEEVERLKIDIQQSIDSSGKNASKRTRDSLEVVSTANGAQLLGANYIGVLETGRKAGKVPYNFAEIIQKWAKFKGITFENEAKARRWASAVAWKIRKEGTQQYNDGRRYDILTKPIDDMTERLTDKIAVEITNNIFDTNGYTLT